MIQLVRQLLTGDVEAEIGHVGEVRQRLLARRMVLPENHLLLWAVLGAPAAHAALDGAAQAILVVVGMAQPHLIEQRDRPQARAADQERQDVALPQSAERIDGLSPQRSLSGFLGWQPRVVLDAACKFAFNSDP